MQHKHGWRFQKRPGVDMFLCQVGYPNFEIVIYTTENAMTFFPIVDGLDPDNRSLIATVRVQTDKRKKASF